MKIVLKDEDGNETSFDGFEWTGSESELLNLMQPQWWEGPSSPDPYKKMAEEAAFISLTEIVYVEGPSYRGYLTEDHSPETPPVI